jgi:hypothetical protein
MPKVFISHSSADRDVARTFRDGPVPGSKGHGLASTLTTSEHPAYPGYHGGGFNPHYAPGDFGLDTAAVPHASAPAARLTPAAYWAPAQGYYGPGN